MSKGNSVIARGEQVVTLETVEGGGFWGECAPVPHTGLVTQFLFPSHFCQSLHICCSGLLVLLLVSHALFFRC